MLNVNGVGRILYGGVEYWLSADGINGGDTVGWCIGDVQAGVIVPNIHQLDLVHMGWGVVRLQLWMEQQQES